MTQLSQHIQLTIILCPLFLFFFFIIIKTLSFDLGLTLTKDGLILILALITSAKTLFPSKVTFAGKKG